MGRRWGKTVLGGTLVLNTLRQHGKAAWIVPTYKNGRSMWRYVQQVCAPLAHVGIMDISKSERMITTHLGGMLGIFSADNIDAIRGEWFHLAVLDEAARISQEARNDAIMPTLADAGGCELDISSPKGLNWFYTEWQRGQDDGNQVKSWRAPTRANPSPQIQRAAALAKERVPARTYDQEWEAQFVADGNYFQNVEACCILDEPDRPDDHPGHTFGMGLDWGKSDDFTSGTIGCRECDRAVDWFHINRFDYRLQRQTVREHYEKWHFPKVVVQRERKQRLDVENGAPTPDDDGSVLAAAEFTRMAEYFAAHPSEPADVRVLPERNSIGEPNIEMLREMGLNIVVAPDGKHGFNMSATTKPMVIELLALALQRGKKYPREYREEFTSYEVRTSGTGHPTFSAPEGSHDDRVISAALENYLAVSGVQLWV